MNKRLKQFVIDQTESYLWMADVDKPGNESQQFNLGYAMALLTLCTAVFQEELKEANTTYEGPIL